MFLSSLYFALLAELKIWQTTEMYSPQTSSLALTAAVVAPAVVICLNSLMPFHYTCSLIEKSPIFFYANGSSYEIKTNLSSKTSGNICNAKKSLSSPQ